LCTDDFESFKKRLGTSMSRKFREPPSPKLASWLSMKEVEKVAGNRLEGNPPLKLLLSVDRHLEDHLDTIHLTR
jgi:hypothetical protein